MNIMDHTQPSTDTHTSLWISPIIRSMVLLTLVSAPAIDHASAHMFLNSAEPQCNGSDPTILMCDDYEDGAWFVTNADTGGRNDPQNDGWAGTIYFTDPLGQNFARCGSKGAMGTNCTATSAYRNTAVSQGGGRGHHTLGPTSETYHDEVYHREYFKVLPGYSFGHEKWTFYERSNSSIQYGLIQTPFSSNKFDFAIQSGSEGTSGCISKRCPQNQGNDITITPGHWYYLEVRLKLSTGTVQMWQDDCGTSGLGCTGTGTLRLSYSGIVFSGAQNLCCDAHQENWCPISGGTCAGEVYRDQTVWATRRIGPMGGGIPTDTVPPDPPTSLRIL
jgi:hypothetical protein